MLHFLIGTACAIFIWKTYQQWRIERFAQKTLAPYGGLTHGLKKSWWARTFHG